MQLGPYSDRVGLLQRAVPVLDRVPMSLDRGTMAYE